MQSPSRKFVRALYHEISFVSRHTILCFLVQQTTTSCTNTTKDRGGVRPHSPSVFCKSNIVRFVSNVRHNVCSCGVFIIAHVVSLVKGVFENNTPFLVSLPSVEYYLTGFSFAVGVRPGAFVCPLRCALPPPPRCAPVVCSGGAGVLAPPAY